MTCTHRRTDIRSILSRTVSLSGVLSLSQPLIPSSHVPSIKHDYFNDAAAFIRRSLLHPFISLSLSPGNKETSLSLGVFEEQKRLFSTGAPSLYKGAFFSSQKQMLLVTEFNVPKFR